MNQAQCFFFTHLKNFFPSIYQTHLLRWHFFFFKNFSNKIFCWKDLLIIKIQQKNFLVFDVMINLLFFIIFFSTLIFLEHQLIFLNVSKSEILQVFYLFSKKVKFFSSPKESKYCGRIKESNRKIYLITTKNLFCW